MSNNTRNFIIITTTYLLTLFMLVAAPLCLYYLTHGNIHNHNLFIGTCVWSGLSLMTATFPALLAAIVYDMF